MTAFPASSAPMIAAIRRASEARAALRSGTGQNPNEIDPDELKRRREAILRNMQQTDLKLRQSRMAGDQTGALAAEQEFAGLRQENNDINRELEPVQSPDQVMAARKRLQDQVPGAIESGVGQLQAEASIRQNKVVENQRRLALGESRSAYGVQNPPDDFLDQVYTATPVERRAQLNRGVPEGDPRIAEIPGEIAALRARGDKPIDFGPVPERDPAEEAARRTRILNAQRERTLAESRRNAAVELERTDTNIADAQRRQIERAATEATLAGVVAQRERSGADAATARRDARLAEAETPALVAQAERDAAAALSGEAPLNDAEIGQIASLTRDAQAGAREIASMFGGSVNSMDAGQGGVGVSQLASPAMQQRIDLIADEVVARTEALSRSADPQRRKVATDIARSLLAALPEPWRGEDKRLRGTPGEYRVIDDNLIFPSVRDSRVAREAADKLLKARRRLESLLTSAS